MWIKIKITCLGPEFTVQNLPSWDKVIKTSNIFVKNGPHIVPQINSFKGTKNDLHSSLSTSIWYCSPDERFFTETSPFSHSELPTNISLRAFIRAARLNTLQEEEDKDIWSNHVSEKPMKVKKPTYQRIVSVYCGTYRDILTIMYHFSGLFSNTKSTLWPFSLRIVATEAAAPWRSVSRAHTIFSTCWPTSGISPFSFSSWALTKTKD